jgi:uncharacterized membrane protein
MEETNQNLSGSVPSGQKNTGLAMVAYLLFFVPLLTEQKNDPFVKYHVKQGFVLFVAACANMLIATLIPVLFMLYWLLSLGVLALLIVGLINASSGKEKPLPVIGHLADKVNFL